MSVGVPIVCRRADIGDVDAILSIIGDDQAGYRHHWGHFNIEKLIETRFVPEQPLADVSACRVLMQARCL